MKAVILRYVLRILLLSALLFCKKGLELNKTFIVSNLYDILHSIIEFFIFFTIVNIVTTILVIIYRLRKNIPYKFTDNVINGINNLYYIIVTFGIMMMILGFWGINFKDLLTSLSIVGAAIAIISKDFISSIVSGIIISFSKEINIDDYVKIGENKGKIIDINLSKVALLNDDDDIIYIPNDKVYLAETINYTKRELKKISIDFEIDLKYLVSIEDLETSISKSLKSFHKFIEPDSFNIKIVDVHHEYLVLKFQCKLIEVNREVERMIRKMAIRLIANSVKKT
ncbi:MAG: mechanosensitive ion channel [Saprospiraceae bacterium]|nr:mechanosensitive ion channel [Saprospiraceae bacterium]